MSFRYKGGFKTATVPAQTSAIWTTQSQLQGATTLPGQAMYTTAGTYTWTVPAGVTSICVAVVGGGGGGGKGNLGGCYWFSAAGGPGGGTAYVNNISVVPGATYTVTVGAAGVAAASIGTSGGAGGASIFQVSGGGTILVRATGGNPNGGAYYSNSSQIPGTATVGTGYTGGKGGNGITGTPTYEWGGGGGSVASLTANGSAGLDDGTLAHTNYQGYGLSLYNNALLAPPTYFQYYQSLPATLYGAGSGGVGGGQNQVPGTNGAAGAVRIIWGSGRAFPNTLTIDL